MPWIALAYLLALTSSAFGRSTYGSDHGQQQIPSAREYSILSVQQQDASVQQKLHDDDEVPISSLTETLPVQGYDATSLVSQTDQHQIQDLTEADILCRGQRPETVIPLDDGRRFVVCVDDGKGFEQQCPRGLYYHPDSRRCERKFGPLEDVCPSQPCLNGGQCLQTAFSYECQCAPGFDGRNCEVDARVCQTQQPCGQSPDARCQSFRLGSALPYICILQNGLAYGLNAQQAKPSPCQGVDGTHALLVSEKGFIMCDGENMIIESCPGSTIWDDVNKVCTWPDMKTDAQIDQQQQDTPVQLKLHDDYGVPIPSLTKTLPVQVYDATSLVSQTDQHKIQVLTEADILCRGQRPETVIPLDDGRRFVVCLDDSKGFEQQCPKGLSYHPASRRCERKLGALESPCSSQPCLNNGQCLQTDSSYQCQCASGFDGEDCELDARVCQTQQPCGQSPDARCQSFRLHSALPYICILEDGLAYGLNAQQANPSPCQGVDGVHALLVSEKGFIMCDGESMFVESCPGGTIWDDVNKACTWPDMQTVAQLDQQQQDHPKQILTNTELSLLKNVCGSQPCLNGGQCISTDSSYQCQCAPGFDSKNCELDARVCQTQQPCGQSPDARCQSFRLGSALPYICILQNGLAYGLNAQQAKPSPCQGVDGTHALLVSEKGFIMCDGELMFVESCPGGTIWNDANKACIWPDMKTYAQLDQQQDHGQSSYGQQQTTNIESVYDI